jgi:Ca2+-transporting ATPase
MQSLVSQSWHSLPAEYVLEVLGTDAGTGLDTEAVVERHSRFGGNVLSRKQSQGAMVRFLLQFHQPLIYILLAAALITAVLQEWVDALVIFGVVLVNAVVGFIQESKAVTAIEALAKSLSSEATVMRHGHHLRVVAADLVPGDIVLLQSGDKVPADLRLVRLRDLQIDESALTGESVPVQKHVQLLPQHISVTDRKNMAYSSTLVTYGTGTGVVIATGDDTEIGRISEMIATAEVLETPLTRKITRFSQVLLGAILALASMTFVIGLLRGQPWIDTFMAAVALAVAAIPEGLPAAVTIILAIGVSRMAKRRAIIRRLPAVETLGSTTVICSDKTGTLTQNQMTVQALVADGQHYDVTGVGYAPEGTITSFGVPVEPTLNVALSECLHAGLLCNDAVVVYGNGGWHIEGDPTEGALLVAAQKANLQPETLAKTYPRLDAIPFESQYQYMATLHNMGPGQPRMAYIKGSIESLLPRCTRALDATGNTRLLNVQSVQEQLAQLASRGLRVLTFARKEFPAATCALDHANVAEGLTFLGFQAMIDPPRPEAIHAVAACQRAGIRVKMITGDHAVTAAAIARQLGIDGTEGRSGHAAVLTSADLSELSDATLIEAVQHTAVFARVSPEHKLRLVEALQQRGDVVAMTGDGVNDAPALRRADIGIAMGQGGTEVAREAADMVLTDDNFAAIEAAVEEGRGVYDNLLKFILWTLPTNGGEGLVILLAILLGVSLPILPVQILWINMTTAVCLGMMLAFEPKEDGIMERVPRSPGTPILTGALVVRTILVLTLLCAGAFTLFNWELATGGSESQANTAAVTVFVVGELFYLFNCRSLTRSMWAVGLFSNPWSWIGSMVMILLQVLFVYMPIFHQLFQSAALEFDAWWRIFAIGMGIYTVIGIEKWLRRRFIRATAFR